MLNDKDTIINDKDVVITEITNQNNWLRGEYAKLNDRLNALLLPAPKKSIWDKILRRKTTKVDWGASQAEVASLSTVF